VSEYQYYEFLAVDRPLTAAEMAAVGRYSSRAEITATSFVNEYNYGSFRGDPDKFLEKYFDLMVYVANWGTRRLMFAVPRTLIDLKDAKRYFTGHAARVRAAGDRVLFDLDTVEREGEGWTDGRGLMVSLAPVRGELLGGDRRVLFLAWLVSVQWGNIDDKSPVPPVPGGLAKLTAGQKSLAEFMELDEDLLAAAVQWGEAAAPEPVAQATALSEWVATLPAAEKDEILVALSEGRDAHLGGKLRRRYDAEMGKRRGGRGDEPAGSGQTAGELRAAAEVIGVRRRQETARRKERERAAQQAKAAAEREVRIAALARREAGGWEDVERLIGMKQKEAYDEAVKLLGDLREVTTRAGRGEEFRKRIVELRARHARKVTFVQRMDKARVGEVGV